MTLAIALAYITALVAFATFAIIAFIMRATDYAAKADAIALRKLAAKDVAAMVAVSKRYHHEPAFAQAYDAELARLFAADAAVSMEPKTLAHNVIARMS